MMLESVLSDVTSSVTSSLFGDDARLTRFFSSFDGTAQTRLIINGGAGATASGDFRLSVMFQVPGSSGFTALLGGGADDADFRLVVFGKGDGTNPGRVGWAVGGVTGGISNVIQSDVGSLALLEVVRVGNEITIYENGVSRGTSTAWGASDIPISTIGSYVSGASGFNGKIQYVSLSSSGVNFIFDINNSNLTEPNYVRNTLEQYQPVVSDLTQAVLSEANGGVTQSVTSNSLTMHYNYNGNSYPRVIAENVLEVGAVYLIQCTCDLTSPNANQAFVNTGNAAVEDRLRFFTGNKNTKSIVVTAETTGLRFYIDEPAEDVLPDPVVFEDIKVLKIADAVAKPVNFVLGDTQEFTQDDDYGWVGPNLVTQDVWENPATVPSFFTYEPVTNSWYMLGDGSFQSLVLVSVGQQPDNMLVSGVITDIEGAGVLLAASNAPLVDEDGPYKEIVRLELSSTQGFKRVTGIVNARIFKPTIQELLEYTS